MLVLTSAPRVLTSPNAKALTREIEQAPQGDSVTLGVLQPGPAKPPAQKAKGRWKTALIGGAAGALVGSLGGAMGGSVGGVAVAPVVAMMGGAAAASTYKFHGNSKGTTASAETRSLITRVAAAGLAGAAVVALGAHGGWVGAVAAGVGGLATGAALGYGLG
jgi:hypothetical protein